MPLDYTEESKRQEVRKLPKSGLEQLYVDKSIADGIIWNTDSKHTE
jgi:hypothetical protein